MIVILIIAVAAALFFIPKDTKKLKIGMMPIVDNLQLFVAIEKGFFKEAGLEIEATPMVGGSIIAAGVASGNLDIGWSNTVSLVVAHEQGFDFKIFTTGSFVDAEISSIITLISAPGIDSAKQCEGKTFALNTFGNIAELVAKAWLYENNANLDEVTFVEIPFPQMGAVLKNNQAQCMFVVEPFKTLIVEEGIGKVMDPAAFKVVSDRFLLGTWFARESWIKENPKKLGAFKAAIDKATVYILENPSVYQEILPKYTKLSEELVSKIELPLYSKELKADELQSVIDASYKYGFITKKFDASELMLGIYDQKI